MGIEDFTFASICVDKVVSVAAKNWRFVVGADELDVYCSTSEVGCRKRRVSDRRTAFVEELSELVLRKFRCGFVDTDDFMDFVGRQPD